MNLTGIDRLLWALSFIGHCILLAVLLFRQRAAHFPMFTALISVNILRTIVLFFTFRFGSAGNYFYIYWTFATVDLMLQLGVVSECSNRVFRPTGDWAPDVRRGFLVMSGASVFVASAMTWLAAPPTKTLRLAVIIRGDFFASCLMSELFVSMIALSVAVGLAWRTHVARLAQGLGVYSIYGILTSAAHSYFGSDQTRVPYRLFSRLQIVLYLFCVAYWSITLARKEPESRKMPEHLHIELRRLQSRAAQVLKSLRSLGSAS